MNILKVKKYPELNELKGKLRAEKYTYRKLAEAIGMEVSTLNNKINGYSSFNTVEMDAIATIITIKPDEFVKYFFPRYYSDFYPANQTPAS